MMSMTTTIKSMTRATPQSFCSRMSSTGKMAWAPTRSSVLLPLREAPTFDR